MLKKFRDDLAVDITKINALEVLEEDDTGEYTVIAYVQNLQVTLEWFETQEDAEIYLDKLINEINGDDTDE